MDSIKNLIEQINSLRDTNNPLYDHIKRPDILISGLKQLDELIGMKQLKETIMEIVFTHLLDCHKNSTRGIYYGLGVNETKKKIVQVDNWHDSFDELSKSFSSLNRNFNNLKEKYPRRKINTPRVGSDDIAWRDMEIGLSIATSNLSRTKNLVDIFLERQEETKISLEDDEKDYLVVCGRNELVAKFSGQSAGLAYNFLLNNRGKTIIIEEAYILYTGDKDIWMNIQEKYPLDSMDIERC